MRDLSLSIGLDTVGEDIYYTLIRLNAHPDTKPLAAELDKQLTAVDAAEVGHRKLQRAVAKTAAEAAGARVDVEGFAADLERVLLPVFNLNRRSKAFLTYFGDPVSTVQGYAEPKLRAWIDGIVTLLTVAPEKELKALLPKAKAVQAAWTVAEVAQAAAVTANGHDESAVRTPLRNDVNAARRHVYRQLGDMADAKGLRKRWVNSFFRSVRTTEKKPAVV